MRKNENQERKKKEKERKKQTTNEFPIYKNILCILMYEIIKRILCILFRDSVLNYHASGICVYVLCVSEWIVREIEAERETLPSLPIPFR